jgi:L-fuculose-phosphate aldolase
MSNTLPVREAVVRLARALADRGFLAGTGGNIALRIDAETFAVTPSATDYYTMHPVDVPVLRLESLARIEGERTPSVESSLHSRVFRHRPDCRFSVHTHQPVASACALIGMPLAVDEPAERALLGPQVAIVGYAPSGTAWLAGRLARALTPTINAYLMRNHGILCCGTDLERAVETVVALERVSASTLRRRIGARAAAHAGQRKSLSAVLGALDRSSS